MVSDLGPAFLAGIQQQLAVAGILCPAAYSPLRRILCIHVRLSSALALYRLVAIPPCPLVIISMARAGKEYIGV
jgi:hypothetical protein